MTTHTAADQGDFELGKRSIAGSSGQIVLITLFVIFTDFRLTHPGQLWLCAAIITLANLFRFILGARQSSFFPGRRKLWLRLFYPTILLPGLTWGILFFLVLRHRTLTDYATVFLYLIGSGISAAVMTSLTPRRKLALSFITLVLGPPFIALLLKGSFPGIGMALIFLTYYGFLNVQLKIVSDNFSEGVRNRQRIEEQHHRLQRVMDAIPGLVLWVGPDLVIRGVNRSYAVNYGGSTEEFLGKDLSYKNSDREFYSMISGFVRVPTRQSAFETRLCIRKANRWHLLVMQKSALLTQTGLPDEIYIICIDVHDLKQAQSELEQQRIRAELNSKLAALGEVTASVAHEIRNPLTAILTSSELIRRQLTSPHFDLRMIGLLSDRIIDTAKRLNQILDSLRGFSRKAGGEPYVMASLRHIIHDSVELMRANFYSNQVSLQVDPVDESVLIHCRPVEISEVVVNLLSNALDAAKEQREKWVRVEFAVGESQVSFRVIDSGRGISPDIVEQIFTPFFTTKPSNLGTGLGLSISRRLVQRHHGSLELDRSATNTTFVVRLPRAQIAKKSA